MELVLVLKSGQVKLQLQDMTRDLTPEFTNTRLVHQQELAKLESTVQVSVVKELDKVDMERLITHISRLNRIRTHARTTVSRTSDQSLSTSPLLVHLVFNSDQHQTIVFGRGTILGLKGLKLFSISV